MMQEQPTFLTDEELIGLTGYRRGDAQVRWLKAQGFKYRLDRRNRPRVDRTHYLQKMGAKPVSETREEPDWSGFAMRHAA